MTGCIKQKASISLSVCTDLWPKPERRAGRYRHPHPFPGWGSGKGRAISGCHRHHRPHVAVLRRLRSLGHRHDRRDHSEGSGVAGELSGCVGCGAPLCVDYLFSSVQDGIRALGKGHMRSTPSLRSFPNVALPFLCRAFRQC